jgi:glycine/D-amino acid oxidase-like deaminating enzyme
LELNELDELDLLLALSEDIFGGGQGSPMKVAFVAVFFALAGFRAGFAFAFAARFFAGRFFPAAAAFFFFFFICSSAPRSRPIMDLRFRGSKEFGEGKCALHSRLNGPAGILPGRARRYNGPMTTPFWLDEPYTPRGPLDGDAAADLVVLGGGVTGVAAARFLAERGCRVALVERDALASGATGRNAGFLLCGIASTYSVAVKSHGRERSKQLWSLSRENHALIRDLVEREGLDCLYARRGSTTLALSEQEAKALSRSAAMLAQDGFRAEFLDDTAVAGAYPGGGFLAGLHHPDDGEIHPARFVRGLAQAAERRGARIFEGTPVSKIVSGADSVTLETPRGRLSASMLLLASNAWTARLHPFFDGAIVGMRGQMFATEPCAERVIPHPVYVDFGFEYFRQLPDGRILAGGGRRASLDTELTYSDRPTEKVQGAIESFLHSCFPATRTLRITHRWAGTMGFSCDELPSVGPVPGSVNTYVAAGYHGHGLGYAVAAAKAVTEMMLDGKSSLPGDLLSPRRHLQE